MGLSFDRSSLLAVPLRVPLYRPLSGHIVDKLIWDGERKEKGESRHIAYMVIIMIYDQTEMW